MMDYYLHYVFGSLDGEVGHLNEVVRFRDLSQPVKVGLLDEHHDGLIRGGVRGLNFKPIGKY